MRVCVRAMLLGLILSGSCYGGDPTASVVAVVAYNYAKVCKYGDLAVPIHYFPHTHTGKKLQFIFAGWLTVCSVCKCVRISTSLAASLCVCAYVCLSYERVCYS